MKSGTKKNMGRQVFPKDTKENEKAYYDTTGASEDSVLPQYRRAVLVNYVEENKLDITACQDYGWDPVSPAD